jgi:alkylation response protein AidB-like acyl-CoA dehydrogenase
VNKHGARALGVAERCIEMGARYSKQRTTFGKPLSERQGITFNLADSTSSFICQRDVLPRRQPQVQGLKEPAAMEKIFDFSPVRGSRADLEAKRWKPFHH